MLFTADCIRFNFTWRLWKCHWEFNLRFNWCWSNLHWNPAGSDKIVSGSVWNNRNYELWISLFNNETILYCNIKIFTKYRYWTWNIGKYRVLLIPISFFLLREIQKLCLEAFRSNQALSVVNLSSFTDTDTIMLLLSLIPYWFFISELPLYYLSFRKMKILHFGLCVFLVVKPSFLLNIIGKDDYFRNIIFWKIAISYRSCINVSTSN